MARYFVAVWPPPPVVDALARLRRDPQEGVRFSTPEQWHVTLRFLGDGEESALVAAVEGLRFPSATAVLGPAVERIAPGVVVAPVAGLDDIAGSVRVATAGLGDASDPRPFRGHLTLARQKAGDHCSLDGVPVAAEFAVDEVALVRSELHQDGARYTTVTTVAVTS